MNNIVIQNNQITNGINNINSLYNEWQLFIQGSEKTVDTYTKAVKQFIVYLNDNGISQPTKKDIIAYRECLKATHKPTTVQSYIMALKQFFKWTEEEQIYKNIAQNVKGAKLDTEHKKDYLTAEQCKELLKAIDRSTIQGKRDYAIISLMLTSGLRTIEISRANIEDISTIGGESVLYIQGKGHEERTQFIKLSEQVKQAIQEYVQCTMYNIGEPLFKGIGNRNEGGRLTTKTISRLVKSYLVKAGYNSDRLTVHSLRHTAATLNLLNGVTIEETQQLLRQQT